MQFPTCSKFLVLGTAAVFLWACGGGDSVSSNGTGGTGGSDQGGAGGAIGGAAGVAGDPATNGGSGPAGGMGGGSGGSGGVAGITGMAGMTGAAGMMGAAGTPGMAGAGGAVGAVDKTKEKIWFDGNVNLGSMAANTTAPANWLAPINYYDGQIFARLNVTKGIPEASRIEICMSKTGGGDPKHTCPTLISNIMGVGEFTKRNVNAGGLLLNILAQSTMVKADFETPFATSEFHLIKEHGTPLAGPVMGHFTLVLVPKGLEFSGWAGYPKP